MQNEVKGYDASHTISYYNVDEKNNKIEVIYIDDTYDVFELNEDNIKRINDIMQEQAIQFVNYLEDEANKKDLLKHIKKMKIYAGITTIGGAAAIATSLVLTPMPVAFTVYGASLVAIFVGMCKEHNAEKVYEDYKKYNAYLTNQQKFEIDYQEIMAKEKKLSSKFKKERNNISINTIDDYTLNDLKQIMDKVERYQDIDSTVTNNAEKVYTKRK